MDTWNSRYWQCRWVVVARSVFSGVCELYIWGFYSFVNLLIKTHPVAYRVSALSRLPSICCQVHRTKSVVPIVMWNRNHVEGSLSCRVRCLCFLLWCIVWSLWFLIARTDCSMWQKQFSILVEFTNAQGRHSTHKEWWRLIPWMANNSIGLFSHCHAILSEVDEWAHGPCTKFHQF